MKSIKDTSELIKLYNEYKVEILARAKKRVNKAVRQTEKYSHAYYAVKEEILEKTGINTTNCQCNKLAYLVLEELGKDDE